MQGFYSLQDAAIVAGLCLAIAFAMRCFDASRGKIALVVLCFGAVFSPLIHYPPPADMRERIAWDAKHVGVGAGIAFGVLYFYRAVLKKIEEKLGAKGDEDDKPKFPPTASPE